MSNFMAKTVRGYTLIEIMVVLTIIGMILGLALVSLGSSQKTARDTTRKSDLKQYQNALEVFANNNGGLFLSYTSSTYASGNLCIALGLSGCPEDPRGTPQYRYESDGTGGGATNATRYALWATLETSGTTTYWVICSDGRSGTSTTRWDAVTNGACPL